MKKEPPFSERRGRSRDSRTAPLRRFVGSVLHSFLLLIADIE